MSLGIGNVCSVPFDTFIIPDFQMGLSTEETISAEAQSQTASLRKHHDNLYFTTFKERSIYEYFFVLTYIVLKSQSTKKNATKVIV